MNQILKENNYNLGKQLYQYEIDRLVEEQINKEQQRIKKIENWFRGCNNEKK